MKELVNIKLWPERRAFSRGRWDAEHWEKKYSMSWGNRTGWRDEKKKLAKMQQRMTMVYQLQR